MEVLHSNNLSLQLCFFL